LAFTVVFRPRLSSRTVIVFMITPLLWSISLSSLDKIGLNRLVVKRPSLKRGQIY
jgi:hypothetical protein